MPLRQLVIFTDPKRGRHPVPPRATWESGRVGQGHERELSSGIATSMGQGVLPE